MHRTVETIFDLSRRGIGYRAVQFGFSTVQPLGDFPGVPVAQRAVLQVLEAEGPSKTHSVLLTAARNHFVKLLVTESGDDADAEGAALLPLYEAIGRALVDG